MVRSFTAPCLGIECSIVDVNDAVVLARLWVQLETLPVAEKTHAF